MPLPLAWRLARDHQVLCITHLPQIAAYADAHYAASKAVEGGRTVTRIKPLDPQERLGELAAMLGGEGAGQSARQSAEELLARAAEWTRGSPGQLDGPQADNPTGHVDSADDVAPAD